MDENAAGQVIVEPAIVTIPSAGTPPETQTTPETEVQAKINTEKPSENTPSEMEKKFADGFLNARNPVQMQATATEATASTQSNEAAATAQPVEVAVATDAAAEAQVPGAAANAEPMQETQTPNSINDSVPVNPRPRDWVAEWKELADAHPEVVGKPIPDDIYKACLTSEQTPLRVYESMMLTKLSSEIDALRAENATLRQNAEAGARAPVTPSTGGANTAAEDAFLRGFNLRYGH